MAYPKSEHPMTALAATELTRKLVAREMRGPSDTGPALCRLESKYGLPFWTMEHLRKGRAKTVDALLFARLRAAYLDHCRRQIAALQHELELERASGDDRNQDLLAETETLMAKLEAWRT